MRIAVIGGTGTIGSAVVKQLAPRHEVVVCGRNSGDARIDITSPDSVRQLFETVGELDGVVCAAGEAVFKPMSEMSAEDYAAGFAYKLMGQVNVVQVGQEYVRPGGSFTLTSGITSRQPMAGSTAYSMVNAGIEGFVRAAALDMPSGMRINAVSPQWTNVTLERYGMDPAWGVPPEQVALGYVESVEGTRTGAVIDAAWQYDWAANAVSIGA